MSRPRAFLFSLLCIVAGCVALSIFGKWTGLTGGLWPVVWGGANGIVWSRLYTRLRRS